MSEVMNSKEKTGLKRCNARPVESKDRKTQMTNTSLPNEQEIDQKHIDIAPEMLANVTFTSWLLAEAQMRDISYETFIDLIGVTPDEMLKLQDGLQDWNISQIPLLSRFLNIPAEEVFRVWQEAYKNEKAG